MRNPWTDERSSEGEMRIGMLAWESLYSIKVGGMAPHVSELAEALVKRGNEVHIFTRRGDFDTYDRINGVHYQRVQSDSSGDIVAQMDKMSSAMYDRFLESQKISGRFDIIHGHDWHPVPALNRIKAEFKLPYILTMHSTEWGRGGTLDGIYHREWLGGYESAQIIVASERMRKEIKKVYSIPDYKINVIPNGLDGTKKERGIDPAVIKEKYGIRHRSPLVLFCGRMVYQKGPDLLLEAVPLILKKHGDTSFFFVGEGDLRAACERRARELKIDKSCRFLGYLSELEKEKLMNACDVMCVPSRNEPFGMVVLEAWHAGKPVVATDAVSIIRNFRDGLLAYIQPESLAWCIKRLLDSPKEGKKLAKAGCSRVKAEFSWDKIAKKTEEVYDKVLHPH